MQVSDPNNVKIYNLSAGKSVPDWVSDRKRRQYLKNNIDVQRRIELIQDFDMPDLSSTVKISPDGRFIVTTGIYKPRMKCYEVSNLSLKFERCFDSEPVACEILSDDYSKLAFLHCDRYLEFHSQGGRYYRLRIPKAGRDLKYDHHTCDMYICASSPDIYRLNLERGQFLNSYETSATEVNRMAVNPEHNLLVCGTKEGTVEAWDPRTRGRVGTLDCAIGCAADSSTLDGFPSVTALNFQGGLTLGVGTATGHVLLYDIRSDKPFYVKDHMYGLPIRDIVFHSALGENLVLSMDSSIVKIWDRNDGKPFTSVEAKDTEFNNLCLVPNSGLFFIANDSPKMQSYYIPSLGPAPKWCAFLDGLTEELEENNMQTVYDDYKFVTRKELDELGLDHLLGTNLLRAYMHGHFMDLRLYKKAKALADPFAFEEYRKKKIREQIDSERSNRVVRQVLPKVNKDLALKMIDEQSKPAGKKRKGDNLLEDSRFKALFENPDFEVDKTAEEYRLINPAISKLTKTRAKELTKQLEPVPLEEEADGKAESSSDSAAEDSDSDEDREWTQKIVAEHRAIKAEHRQREDRERREEEDKKALDAVMQPKFFELREGEEFRSIRERGVKRKRDKSSLGERAARESQEVVVDRASGSKEMCFKVERRGSRGRGRGREREVEDAEQHRQDRLQVRRMGIPEKRGPRGRGFRGGRGGYR